MTALLRVVLASALVLGSPTMARAADPWAALAQRIAATDPRANFTLALGAQPPGFVFPLPVPPALPVAGSRWFGPPNGAPVIAHIYYAPTSHTGTAWDALRAQLTAARYKLVPERYPPSFNSRLRHWCPEDLRRPAIDVGFDRVDGLPAMDIEIRDHADATLCRNAVTAATLKEHQPVLAGIPAMNVHARMMLLGGAEDFRPFATGTIETALTPEAAIAKLAERYVAKGWVSEPVAINGDTTTQRFTLLMPTWRFTTLLVLDRRTPGVFDLLIAINDGPLDAR